MDLTKWLVEGKVSAKVEYLFFINVLVCFVHVHSSSCWWIDIQNTDLVCVSCHYYAHYFCCYRCMYGFPVDHFPLNGVGCLFLLISMCICIVRLAFVHVASQMVTCCTCNVECRSGMCCCLLSSVLLNTFSVNEAVVIEKVVSCNCRFFLSVVRRLSLLLCACVQGALCVRCE